MVHLGILLDRVSGILESFGVDLFGNKLLLQKHEHFLH
jgi:hypothetical protein